MRKILMCLILSLMFCCIAYAQRSSWNQGDLKMYGHSIDGDSTNGLNFDPDADATNEIVMNADGTITVLQVTYTGTDGNNGDVLTTDGAGTLSFSASAGAFTPTTDGGYLDGDLSITGSLSANGDITTQGAFFGDGSNLTGTLGAWTTTVAGAYLDGDASMTGTLSTDGDLTAQGNISATTYGSNQSVSDAELLFVGGATSDIQTQINGKEGTLTNSSGLASALSDETGTGLAVFSTSPEFATSITLVGFLSLSSELTVGTNFYVGTIIGTGPTDDIAVETIDDIFLRGSSGGTGDDLVIDMTNIAVDASGNLTADGVLAIGVNVLSVSGNITLTTSHTKGTVVYCDGAATITLPVVASGMSFVLHTIGDVAVSIDPNANDQIVLDGVVLDDGDKITNKSDSGDVAVLTYFPDNDGDGGSWYASTGSLTADYVWTDGG